MKKIFTLCVVALVAATTVSAKDYKHSVGMVGGLGVGAQYKTMITDHFTILAELGYFTCPDGGEGWGYMGAPIVNGVFAYQTSPLAEGNGIKLSVYAGGQTKLGYVLDGWDGLGLFGVGAAAGIEANMINAPIAFSFDFRPGYAMSFGKNYYGPGTMTLHQFDYSVNVGVRYTF